MSTQRKERQLRVSHVEGSSFLINVRGHEVLVDQPVGPTGDGTDTGPTPTELFVASVAGCAAYYGRTYLATRGLPDGVDVVARWDYGSKPDRVTRIRLLVDAPGVPPEKRDVFQRVVEGCLVHNTLMHAPDVVIRLDDQQRGRTAAG